MAVYARSRRNIVLIELIVVIFFFALSAAITLQMFGAAHDFSADSAETTEALLLAQDWAEQIAASGDPTVTLTESGWELSGDKYRLAVSEVYTLAISLEIEAARAGDMAYLSIEVYGESPDGTQLLLTLPVSLYLPGTGEDV